MTTRSETENNCARRDDQNSFSAWEPGQSLSDRLRFDGCDIAEGNLVLRFFSPASEQNMVIETDTHLLVRYANESANFVEFDQLPIANQRMFVSRRSMWLRELSVGSSGVFDELSPMHYVFIFSNASVEMICIGEPRIIKTTIRRTK